jgi:hypothetical protein
LLFDSGCHKDEMMDNVRCGNWMSWGKGKEKRDRCFIMRLCISIRASGAEASNKAASLHLGWRRILSRCSAGLSYFCVCSTYSSCTSGSWAVGFTPILGKCWKADKIEPREHKCPYSSDGCTPTLLCSPWAPHLAEHQTTGILCWNQVSPACNSSVTGLYTWGCGHPSWVPDLGAEKAGLS